jgi:hypothetical protein
MTSIEDKFYFGKHGQPERFEESAGDRRMGSATRAQMRSWIVSNFKTTAEMVKAQAAMEKVFEDDPEYWMRLGWRKVAEYAGVFSRPGQPDEFDLEEACWDGYEPVGTKRKDGRTVPNCVPMKNEKPERFDASSLDRKGFAAASSSPMLGKLLSEKQMPEGGWRAVETGGGALVISFEDGDVAGNFARRVASHGYSATAPVQSIGRYWNVEVKNG